MKLPQKFKYIFLSSIFLASTLMVGLVHASNLSHLEMNHNAGTVMVEAQAMRMNMSGLRSVTSDVSLTEAVNTYGYAMLPETMTMDMYMIMPMYNFTKKLSTMVMLGYTNNKMDMTNGAGTCKSTMQTSGLTDTQVNLNYKFMDDFLVAGMELSIPTGSTGAQTSMKMGMTCVDNAMTAPYPMQIGSGTYDVAPSLAYLGGYFSYRYGALVSYKYRIGENNQGYTLGNVSKGKLWITRPVLNFKLNAELDVEQHAGIDGVHSAINATLPTPLVNTDNSKRLDAFLTVGAEIPVAMTSIGLDVTFPIYQDVRGLQMKNSWSTSLSINAMF